CTRSRRSPGSSLTSFLCTDHMGLDANEGEWFVRSICARLPVLVPSIIAASLGPDPKLEVARGRRRRRLNCAQPTEAPPTPAQYATRCGHAVGGAMGRVAVEAYAEALL